MFKRKKEKAINNIDTKIILSDDAIFFIKKYALRELGLELPIDDDKFDIIFDYACDCELDMIDPNDPNGGDKQYDYPEKERNEYGDKFVTEYSGQDGELDLDDLNSRLGVDN